MVSTQARGFPPLNPRMFLKARIEASCTMSSASSRPPASQRVSRKASTRYGTNTSVKRASSLASSTFKPIAPPCRTLMASWLDDDLSRHMRMQHTEIFNRACIVKGLGERPVSIECTRAELASLLRPEVRNIVVVPSCHRRADLHREHRWLEGEIGDFDLSVRCIRISVAHDEKHYQCD